MHMKTGVEQSVYALVLLNMLPDKAVLPGEAISQQLGTSATYSETVKEAGNSRHHHISTRYQRRF